MLESALLASLTKLSVPSRYDVLLNVSGLQLRRLLHGPLVLDASFAPFKSRGATCRRVLATLGAREKIVIELASFNESYETDITGIIRASQANASADVLRLDAARWKVEARSLSELAALREEIRSSWNTGISYRPEIAGDNGTIRQKGLRLPQRGALHAIASHWTLESNPALVVMPTGTGKTEVMIAASVSSAAGRVLIIVPTDALRHQTANKFLSYGLLQSIGVIGDLPNPIVGTLASAPVRDHFEAIRACNVLVTTMSSIGLTPPDLQKEFASLFTHVFFDEAHHMEAATWKRFRENCGQLNTLLFTATPYREDGKAIDGKIIYEFPLSLAQELGYFRKIQFIEVFEPDSRRADREVAAAAVARLREDLGHGFDHVLLARASTIERATTLYNTVYAPLHADLNPVLVHSRVANKRMVLDAIRSGGHKIIVCVDMFGEGFDLPNLKIAALHNVHKSLGVTLQFIGRFARTGSHVGEATFVANTAEDGVPEALESLYQEDSDWNFLLADLSYDAINPQAELSQLVENLEPAAPTDETTDQAAPEISAIALKPKISGQVYRTSEFHPHRYADAFTSKQRIYHPKISRRDNFLILVVNQEDTLDWTDSRDIVTDSWDLYIGYFDANRNLLYLHSSRKGNATGALASAISKDPVLINGEETFKAFSGLKRLTLYSVGLSSRSKNVRYQLFAGLDVRNAIDPIQQQDKMKSNITGLGYENGKRRTVGCSRKGKIWSMSSGSIADWKSWCDEIGAKLCDPNAQPNDFLKYTLIPSVINELPKVPALMIDWPDQLFESSNFRFQVRSGDASHDFHDCQLDIVEWGARQSFTFVLSAGENLKTRLALEIEPQRDEHGERDSTYCVRYVSGDRVTIQAAGEGWEDVSFFEANPPLVRLADGSQISGNILLKPREELPDTFERALIRTLDWTGVDFKKESRWKDGESVDNSIQGRFIEHLAEGPATFIIDDDDQGESADVVSIEETTDTVIVNLWHCKFAGGATPGARADDLYVVCGQAEKCTKWTWSFENLVKHLLVRENEHRRGRPTRFIRGSAQELVTLRKSARRKFVVFRVGIVQPGLSKANVPPEHLAIIGGTNGFVRCITDEPLTVYASD
jgi:superfamily II DNA or RNA helicase